MSNPHSTSNSGIYIISNTRNNKIYIGQSQDIHQRWKLHQRSLEGGYHHNRYLQRAWDKYGEKSFKFQILEYCPIEQLNEREQHFLDIYIAKGNCYNIAIDAASPHRGIAMSDEAKAKISIANKGMKMPPRSIEHRSKISEANKHRPPPSAETRQKISEAGKRRQPASEETRIKLSKALKGRISPTLGKPTSDETKRKISEAARGRTHSIETRHKMSESQKRRLAKKPENLSHSGT